MPILKSAIKKERQDKKRREANFSVRRKLKETIDAFKKSKKAKDFVSVMSVLDKAAKIGIVHKNKASRLKSRLSKLV